MGEPGNEEVNIIQMALKFHQTVKNKTHPVLVTKKEKSQFTVCVDTAVRHMIAHEP